MNGTMQFINQWRVFSNGAGGTDAYAILLLSEEERLKAKYGN